MLDFLNAIKDPEFRSAVAQGLKDAANRSAASFFGGPVDLATMAMRPLGYNTPDREVVGSSEWLGKQMEQRGMVSTARNPVAEVLAAVAVPAGMARAAPALFRAEQQAVQNAMVPRVLDPQAGAIVWHGSPNKLDNLDSSNINGRQLDDVLSSWRNSGVVLNAGFSNSRPELITLSKIEIPKTQRNQGIGSAVMNDLIEYADESGKTIALSPSTDFGASSSSRLKAFYKRFGFVENKGRNKDFTISDGMYRLPKDMGISTK